MKLALMLSILALATASALPQTATPPAPAGPTTWYVKANGGTRYSADNLAGQCDGRGSAAYDPSGGVNQHCPFNDYRWLYDSHGYGNNKWVIAGGDTVIIGSEQPWRVGFDQGLSANDVWCQGGNGRQGCTNPAIPAGTPSQHTRILGENYANCSTGTDAATATDKSKLSQIFGGFGVGVALNLGSTQYVDIGCLEITRHSQCATHGSPRLPTNCSNNTSPIDDFDSDGETTDVNTANLFEQDVWIHGHTDRGIIGPIGGLVQCLRCEIDYNAMAGWDFDDGGGTLSPNGNWVFNYSSINWNGCNQEYPLTDQLPANACYSQSTGGYGDGVGTPPGFCMNVSIDHSTFNFNTQDGLDLGHLSVVGPSGVCNLSITNSTAVGNGGATFKWGPAPTNVVFTNNLMVANCNRMHFPITGAPASYNANLGDFCRSGDAVSFNMFNGGKVLFGNNTLITYAPTSLDVQCNDPNSCANSVLIFENNIILGYSNTALYDYNGNGAPGGWCLQGCNGTTLPIGTITRTNNLYFGVRVSCLPTEFCEDPIFVNEPTGNGAAFDQAELDNFNDQLSANSPAAGMGATANAPIVAPPPPPPPPVTPPPPPPPPPEIVTVARMANAVTICGEGCTITTMPVATVYQFGTGTGTTWLPPATSTGSSPELPLYVSYTSFPVGVPPFDPDPGFVKELDVQQSNAAFTVTWTMYGSPTVNVTVVPALAPPPVTNPPPPTPPPVTNPPPPPPPVTPPPPPPPEIVTVARMANAVTICGEGCTITTMPVATVYQFGTGTGTTWLPPATSTSSSPELPLYVSYTSFPVGVPPFDPDPGFVKELDVQQSNAAFTVTWTTYGSPTVNVTVVPALAPPPVTTAPPPTYPLSLTIQLPVATTTVAVPAAGI